MNSHRTGIPFTGYYKKTIPQKPDLDTSSSICSSSCEEGEFRPKFWLDNNEVQLTQPQTTQKSFSPLHKDKEELINLSDESEVNETKKEIQERRWGMKNNYLPMKDNNNKHNTTECNHQHKEEHYNRGDKYYKHKRKNFKKEMHYNKNHHRFRDDSYKGKYTQQKTKRDNKYTQHYKHNKYDHKKEQRYNDNKPQFSPIKDDNYHESNMEFNTERNEYDNYKEEKYYHKTNKSKYKDKYYSHDERAFAFKKRKMKDHPKECYYKYKPHRYHYNNNSVPNEYAPPPVQFSN